MRQRSYPMLAGYGIAGAQDTPPPPLMRVCRLRDIVVFKDLYSFQGPMSCAMLRLCVDICSREREGDIGARELEALWITARNCQGESSGNPRNGSLRRALEV